VAAKLDLFRLKSIEYRAVSRTIGTAECSSYIIDLKIGVKMNG